MALDPNVTGLPSSIRDAWNDQDVATTVEWLLSGPAEDRWPDTPTCNGIAVTCVSILLSVDPRAALELLTTLIPRAATPAGRVRLLEQRLDAAARVDALDDLQATYGALADELADLDDPQVSVAVLNNAATHLKSARAFGLAEQVLRDLLATNDLQPSDRIAALINLGTVVGEVALSGQDQRKRDVGPALAVLGQAAELATVLGDQRLLGGVWYNRGFLYGRTGRSAEAVHAYAKSASAYEAGGGGAFDLAYVRRGQAAEAARNGRLGDAASLFRDASALFMEAGHPDESARTNVGLLMAMATAGQSPTRAQLDDLLAVIELTRPAEVPDMLMNFGNILGADDAQAALDLFRRADAHFADQGRARDVCRARHAQAVMIRRLGDPEGALAVMDQVRAQYVTWAIAKEVAEVDFNRSLTLMELGRNDEALGAALTALEELDRHRHTLSGPADRAGILTNTYPHLFDVALDLARHAGDSDLVAALAERVRVQVNPASSPVAGSAQLEPPPEVLARPGARHIAGTGPGVPLVAVARQLLGPGAAWLTWTRHRDHLLRVLVTPTHTDVSAVAWPGDLLLDLRDAIADPTSDDISSAMAQAGNSSGDVADGGPAEVAASDAVNDAMQAATRAALYRAATGPLLADPTLADRLRPTLDPRQTAEWQGRVSSRETFLDELATALLPPALHLDSWVDDSTGSPSSEHGLGDHVRRLVIAPPVTLGRVPWAALPIRESTLIEVADILLAPPLGTLSHRKVRSDTRATGRDHSGSAPDRDPDSKTLWLFDARGDLSHCRAIPDQSGICLSHDTEPSATSDAVLDALGDSRVDTLVIRGHVRAGSPADPLSTAILLSSDSELSARDLLTAKVTAPSRCIVLGCDAAGAATGSEWAGLPLALGFAGADVLVMTLWPVVDDSIQEELDIALLLKALANPAAGLLSWQRDQARRWREREEGAVQPYRWANISLIAVSGARVDV